ncbi:hypothetical protein ACTXI0_15900 [Arthrobacter rhombi]|uniref:hypothetical protein n=1 Tax=Arthrobacter rhombi TaxID=71253 RepID=UPI003FD2F557
MKRHIANEVYGALMEPGLENLVGRRVHKLSDEVGAPLSVLANTLGVTRRRLQRLEAFILAASELEARATAILAQISHQLAA